MRGFVILAAIALASPQAMAQAFQGLAPDMAMSNLHNELQERRSGQTQSAEPRVKYHEASESLASLFVLNWMIANQQDDYPPSDIMSQFIQQASRSINGSSELKGRNTRRKFIGLVNGDFKKLHAEWGATLDDPVAGKHLSDRVWQSFRDQYGVDLRARSLNSFAN